MPPRALRRCASAARARTRAPSAPSCARLTPRMARSGPAGTSTAVAERAGGLGPTARMPGVTAAAAAAATDLSTDRAGRFAKVRAAPKKTLLAHVAVIGTAVTRPDAAAAAAALPRPRAHVTHASLRPVCRVGAGRSAVAAPPQHAEPAGRGGRPAGGSGRNGRCVLAQAAGAGCAGCSSVGCVRCVRMAPSAAAAAVKRPPWSRRSCTLVHASSDRARSTPQEPPAAPRRLRAAWGRSAGGPRSYYGQPRHQGRAYGAAVVACSC